MPNQRELAHLLKLSQSTVSLALSGDASIPLTTQQRVLKMARRVGYFPNSHISALMKHIRGGRKVRAIGCLAILVDAANETKWFTHPAYRQQYKAIVKRAELRGYQTECFFLRSPGMSPTRIDHILQSRGIVGLILSAPMREGGTLLKMRWERYACVTSGYTWTSPLVDRITPHHRHHIELACSELQKRGYQRIGFCFPTSAQSRVDCNWLAGWLLCQNRLPLNRQIPCFTGSPWDATYKDFQKWLTRWQPDALISLIGNELPWLTKLGLTPGKDLAMVCLFRRPDSEFEFTAIDENNTVIGEMLCDLVSALIIHNERGLPSNSRLIQVEGRWIEGKTAPQR